MSHGLSEDAIKSKFAEVDKDKSGELSLKEVKELLKKLNLKPKDKIIKKKFDEVQIDGGNVNQMDIEEFKVFLEYLYLHPAIDELFAKVVKSSPVASAEEFQANWFKKIQGEDIAIEKVREIIAKCERPKKDGSQATRLSSSGFQNFLFNPEYNSAFNPAHNQPHQDMDQPMASYYIASSHNTYLNGHQLKGESSVKAYEHAFEIGCRCVELDCWDGPDGPVIYHGHTLTTKIFFKDVIQTVRDHAFKKTKFPCVLSLEMHCGVEGQNEIARMINETLGPAGMLIDEHVEKTGLLAPSKYMGKVLIKGKMVPFLEEEDEDPEDEKDAPVKGGKAEEKPAEAKKEKPVSISEELSKLTTFSACSFKSFEKAKEKKAWEMSSFSENKVNKMVKKTPTEFIDFNSHHIARVYPKGTRFDSSNYDPVPSWNCGAHMVALNHQTGAEPLWINHGKFLDNGMAGYILKPKYLTTPDGKFLPDSKMKATKTLIINVIGAYQLPKKVGTGKEEVGKGAVVNPYVSVKTRGVTVDTHNLKTGTVKGNGLNPVFNKELKFPLAVPELAHILFVVKNDVVGSDELLGQYSCQVSNLRPGFRMLPLKDGECHTYDKALLLVNVHWK